MKKILSITILICVLATMTVGLAGCGSAVPDRLVGNWKCDEKATGVYVDTSFYSLKIESNGEFKLMDNRRGKAAISGTMKGDDTGKLGILELKCEGPFKPPACWPNLHKNSRLRYKIIDDKTIRLGYVGIWMTFRK